MAEKEEFKPRPYQIDLYEKALVGNTIIYLPTGAGKTYVTVMVIKHMSPAIRIPWKNGGQRTIFVVNTVPLVIQQCAYIRKHTDLSCNGYSGDDLPASDHVRWTNDFEEYQVLVMTAQILLDLLNHGCLPLSRINLLIFDECHHAVGDHPMRLIMKRFENYDESQHPKILGTSATLLNSNIKTQAVEKMVHELEVTFHAKVITVDSLAPVKGYGKPSEMYVVFDPPDYTSINEQLDTIIDYVLKILGLLASQSYQSKNQSSHPFQSKTKNDKLKCIFEDIREHINDHGLYIGSLSLLAHIEQMEKIKKSISDVQEIHIMNYVMTRLVVMRKIVEDEMQNFHTLEQISRYSTDQFLQLVNLIKHFYEKSSDDNKFCCIIFVRRRFTAKVLYHVLQDIAEHNKNFKFLVTDYLVGSSPETFRTPSESMSLKQWNAKSLENFRKGVVNCLVATDVLDEGIDIPACSLVVRYDVPQDFRAYVQSKGRGRHSDSTYVMLISKEDQTFQCKIKKYHHIEAMLRNQLIGKTDCRFDPLPQELQELLYANDVESYMAIDTAGIQSVATEVSAVSLIHRYCNALGSSNPKNSTPVYTLKKLGVDGKLRFQVLLQLPTSSPVKETVVSDVMPSIVAAKRSVAVKACRKLHEIGELTDRLLPKNALDIVRGISTLLDNWQEENDQDPNIVGTNIERSYDIIHPEELSAAFPRPHEKAYLHVIEVIPSNFRKNKALQVIFDTKVGFAILSSKQLPQLPQFSIFMAGTPLIVHLKVNHTEMGLPSDKITELHKFHTTLFGEDVLKLMKKFMVHDKDNLENSFLIVPVNSDWTIDWDVVNHHKVQKFEIPSSTTLHDLSECVEQLVRFNHRMSSEMYMITCVEGKVDSQPRMVLTDIPTEINLIKPTVHIPVEQMEIEVSRAPICHRIDFPALYWVKALTLPSILHRINQQLVVNDLRQQIVSETGLGKLFNIANKLKALDLQSDNVTNDDGFSCLQSGQTHDGKVKLREHMTVSKISPSLTILKKNEESRGPSINNIIPALVSPNAHDLFDFEHLSIVGRSFLKFVTSLYVFETHPFVSEGHLKSYRDRIAGSRHLYYCGKNKNIPGRLKNTEFKPHENFFVPSYCVPRHEQDQTKVDDQQKQNVSDKAVVKAVEALTGVYLNVMGLIGAAKLLQWFGVFPASVQLTKVLSGAPASAKIGDGNIRLDIPWADSIENILGYKFKDRSFLMQAFTHSSYRSNTVTTSYDRLEFLGDAVIDFLITMYIYENCGDLGPGALTDLRSALVNNITFACLTVKYGLHTALLACDPTLSETIERFAKYQKERDHVVNDELLWILLEEDECNMAEYVDVPKTLGDLFNSVIGAIYLDSGKDLNAVWTILYALMHNEIRNFSTNIPKQPVSVLHELPGAKPKFFAPEVIAGTGSTMVPLEVQVCGSTKLFHGFGATKKQAKTAAAKQAIKAFRNAS